VSESKKEWIIRVPKSLVCDTSVSLEARITYVVLMGFEGKNGAPAFPELETIAWILKRHRTNVQRYIRELQSVGWLDKKRFKNKDGQFQSVRYDLLRHHSHDSCLRPQSRKPYTVSPTTVNPTTVNVTTNKTQSLTESQSLTKTHVVVGNSIPGAQAAETTTTTNLEDLIEELQKEYPKHDVKREADKAKRYYNQQGKPLTRSMLRGWMKRAELPLKSKPRSGRPRYIEPPPPITPAMEQLGKTIPQGLREFRKKVAGG
jgi:hypothetical protein